MNSTATRFRAIEDRAWKALSAVTDPELDESLTTLGFVGTVEASDEFLTATLRLPTAFCSPNFAFMMAADSADALRAEFPEMSTRVVLEGNADSERINSAVAAGVGFTDAYPVEAAGDLEDLRAVFRSKAHLASLDRLISKLVSTHAVLPELLPTIRLVDVPEMHEREALLRRRNDLGISIDDNAFVLVNADGSRWDINDLAVQIRFAKATRISIEGNAHFCSGLLRTRYDEPPPGH
ncbi:iron-sulfur cluster assembly protein [Arthrobacter sp. S39]|uniref:iron-sulfur cluster assembly protein n=1 Tax=Arthrobacter sp. S39 TaxID=2509720 RepID=UPI001037317A|nr:iron-sulfur cluster assembly protein [Arthrobacter sp. S39]TAP38786.1 DUF59 domain-containing protein [Arthrobacter sp. S39]